MKKKNLKKFAISLALVGVVGVGGTLAYFSDVTGVLTNTFDLMGDSTNKPISLQLKEHAVDQDGKKIEDSWKVEGEGNEYKNLMPGAIVDKDPTVVIDANTAESLIVVKVENYIQTDILTINSTNIGSKWLDVTPSNSGTTKYFKYYMNVSNNSNSEKLLEPLFDTVTINSQISEDTTINDIVIKAAAVQVENNNQETLVQQAIDSLNA